MNRNIIERCKKIRLVITDVDGVLTDGGMYYSETGEELKKFNVRDGVGVALLKLAGTKIGCITGEKNELVKRRAEKMGMDFFAVGVCDKLKYLENYMADNDFEKEEIAYIGDEINDYCLLGRTGLFFTVYDANDIIKEKADFVLQTHGGSGALREVANILLSAQKKLQETLQSYIENSQRAK